MKSIIKYIFFLFLFVIPNFFGITLSATELSVADSSRVVVRQPEAKFFESYRTQKEFIYQQKPPMKTNFMQRFVDYLKRVFENWKQYSDIIPLLIKIFLWILVLFTLFIVITKTKIYKLFYTDKEIENPDYILSNPEDYEADLDEAIRLQIEQQQYREAIRLLYIKLISTLKAKNYISYSKEKTNSDYLRELTNEDLKWEYHRITSIYNYVWYGDIEVEKDQFVKLEKSFHSFYSTINEKE